MKTFRMPVRVVFYREEGRLYAHSLEFDLIGEGDDHHQAVDDLLNAIMTQVHATEVYKNPANLFTPAPPEIFQRFAEGHAVLRGELEISERWVRQIDNFTLEGLEAREYTPDETAAAV